MSKLRPVESTTYYNVCFYMERIASFKSEEAAEEFASYERLKRSLMLENGKQFLTSGEYRGLKSSVDYGVTVRKIVIEFSDHLTPRLPTTV